MRDQGQFRDLIQKTKIFRRYVLNVRKLPVRPPMFISTITGAQNDVISKYGDEFGIKAKSYNLGEYHKALYIMTRILKPKMIN